MTHADDLPEWINALQQPDAYPHTVGTIKLMQTHLSWLLLTGDLVYKLKKPVQFDFVDFSTLSDRHQFCREELRLNQRFSEGLYVDVVPIVQEKPGYRVDGTGEPIEWAVRMQQFPQSDLASEMLRDDRLRREHLITFAESLGQLHRQANVVELSQQDVLHNVSQPAHDNLATLRRLVQSAETRERIDMLHRWTEETLNQLRPIFLERSQQQKIRDCHGDLHLGNIVWWNNQLTPFDCIEFNASLRQIDVISEIAFLVMDLDDHQRSDLARTFLNHYLQTTGDYAGLRVLPASLVYRALVRAKVAILRLQQGQLSDAERQAIQNSCNSYLELAERYTQPNSPFLGITFGLSGSGKTTGSSRVIEQTGAIRIRSDIERKRLYGLRPTDRREHTVESGLYSSEATQHTQHRLQTLAQSILDSGFSVIVDATFLKQRQRDAFRQIAQERKIPFRIYSFEADEATLRERVRQRQQEHCDASDATIEVLEHQLRTHDPLTAFERQFVIESHS